MSFVIVPLPSGDVTLDRQVRDVIVRLLGGLDRAAGKPNARPREPFWVAALDREGWDLDSYRHWVDEKAVLLPAAPARVRPGTAGVLHASPEDDGSAGVLRRALEALLQHQTAMRAAVEDADIPGAAVWLVVGVVPEGVPATQVMDRFSEVSGLIEGAAQAVSRGRYMGSGHARIALDGGHYIPWLWIPEPPEASTLPTALGEHPPSLVDLAKPVLYTGRAVGGHALRWHDHGMERLFADMVALHALSASKAALDGIFGGVRPDVSFYTFHSSTFEYPLTEHIRQERLRALLSSGDGENAWSSVLPDLNQLDIARARALPTVSDEVKRWVLEVRESITKDELDPNHYDFGGTYRHQPEPSFDSLEQPGPNRWQEFVTADWSIVDPPRQVERLYRETSAALGACVRDDGPRVVKSAMDSARLAMDHLRQRLQTKLQSELPSLRVPHPQPGQIPLRMSNFSYGVGATLAMLDGVREEAARHVRSDKPLPDPVDEVHRQTTALKAAWTATEDDLLLASAAVPSRGGGWLEITAAVLGTVGGVFATLPLVVVGAPFIVGAIGALGTFLLWRKRRAETRAHFQSWDGLGDQWRKLANRAARPLVAAVNDRAREVKKVAALELAAAVEGCTRRFKLEIRGFIDFVQVRHGEESRRRAAEPVLAEALRVGRYRYVPPVSDDRMNAEAQAGFERELCNKLLPSLLLVGMPERVPIGDYEDILRSALVTEADEQRVREGFRAEATAEFRRAVEYGLDVHGRERSDVDTGFYPGDSIDGVGGRKVVLIGHSVSGRLSEDWFHFDLLTDDVAVFGRAGQDAYRRVVTQSMMPEASVSLVVRTWCARSDTNYRAGGPNG
jgi:hypothetical protein